MSKSLDKILEDFKKQSEDAISSKRPLWEGTDEDEIYNVDIHIWRKPGMGNSLQTIAGNKISIMTALTSFFNTLISKEVFTKEELELMLKTASKDAKDL